MAKCNDKKRETDISTYGRREFLENFGILAGGAYFLSSLPWFKVFGAEPVHDPGRIVKLGVIGIGVRGTLLIEHLKYIPGVEITAVCDNYPPHLKEAIKLSGVDKQNALADYRHILDMHEIDGVVIATPLYQHAHITIEALEAGKHVMCEKAMARNYEDCFKMVKAQERTGKLLYIGHQRIFDVRYLDGIKRIDEGELGTITHIRAFWHRNNDWRREIPSPELERTLNWRLYKEYSAGVMTELASHQIQVSNWILKDFPTSVMGSGSINFWKDGREVCDNVSLVYNYQSGVKLNYDCLTSNKLYGVDEQILGHLGTMELEKNKYYPETPPPAPGILQLITNIEHGIFEATPLGGTSWVPETAIDRDGEPIIPNDPHGDGTDMLLKSFVESIRKNHIDTEITRQGFYASIASLMGEEAIEKHQTVYFPEQYKI
ncbi:MAG: Gfo/Idh/MocA family oxidoreductase [Bacteroidetes bacterium]|jgi:predicted dehydrogenase|nr:Gfo/Idh/MocA family oxidoreductase [Bacteroidota bacterium]